MFLCRERELGLLERRFRGGEKECVVIYGRRRVGKTALINEFVKEKAAIYFPALKATAEDNLDAKEILTIGDRFRWTSLHFAFKWKITRRISIC